MCPSPPQWVVAPALDRHNYVQAKARRASETHPLWAVFMIYTAGLVRLPPRTRIQSEWAPYFVWHYIPRLSS